MKKLKGAKCFLLKKSYYCDSFEWRFDDEIKGEDFQHLREQNFVKPVLFKDKDGLGMRMPNANFTVIELRQNIGNRRVMSGLQLFVLP